MKNLFLATLVFLSLSPLAAANSEVTLVARHSGLCLDVAGNSYYDWANIQQFRCHGYANQKFTFNLVETDSYGTEWYAIKSVSSGKCLDVARNSYYDQANIIQYSCHYRANQLFKVEELGTYYGDAVIKLVAKSSNKCLDIAGGSYYNNGNLQQFRCHGGNNQAFIVK